NFDSSRVAVPPQRRQSQTPGICSSGSCANTSAVSWPLAHRKETRIRGWRTPAPFSGSWRGVPDAGRALRTLYGVFRTGVLGIGARTEPHEQPEGDDHNRPGDAQDDREPVEVP